MSFIEDTFRNMSDGYLQEEKWLKDTLIFEAYLKAITAPKSWELIAYCTSFWQFKSIKTALFKLLSWPWHLEGSFVAFCFFLAAGLVLVSLKCNFSESSLHLRLFTLGQKEPSESCQFQGILSAYLMAWQAFPRSS